MNIIFHEKTKEFHIWNDNISYIIQILENGQLGNLYYGARIHDQEDYSYLLEGGKRSLAVYNKEQEYFLCQQYTRMEYPSFGTGDFRHPAVTIKQAKGSRIIDFRYDRHQIFFGKKKLPGLPATYVEEDREAQTLEITMKDELLNMELVLSYTIFRDFSAIARNARIKNLGEDTVQLQCAMSLSLDLPDADYEMLHLSGAWSRERHLVSGKLRQGVQGVYSTRGISSAEHNPFLVLKRPESTERWGEAYGFSLIYSGNHLEQVEVDTNFTTRVTIGIHPDTFEWNLHPGEEFQTPEAVTVYSDKGLNRMSQTFHKLYRTRLARGVWRDRSRPILINNWEATEMSFTEEKILEIARKGKSLGIEMFVLDDGWFGSRDDDTRGLGDWDITNYKKLPDGIGGLSRKIEAMGMKFGLWMEPEMVNKDSELYRQHPDWILHAPGRVPSPSRNQYVLDFSRREIVDYIHDVIYKLLDEAAISYVKWDMNRYITECYSIGWGADRQGEIYHRYILGVYDLYERLTSEFPEILFESCSSGGARFDPGMLYYAPQTWTSDNTDAIERVKIQYGTSFVYPLSSMGAHVSVIPNQQNNRVTPMITRGNVAMFGDFGYELDPTCLSREDEETVRKQILFVKRHRELIQKGAFYRLLNPFSGKAAAWMVVADDQREALAGYYQLEGCSNPPWERLYFQGLNPDKKYCINGKKNRIYYGNELMKAGIPVKLTNGGCLMRKEYSSLLYYLCEPEMVEETAAKEAGFHRNVSNRRSIG